MQKTQDFSLYAYTLYLNEHLKCFSELKPKMRSLNSCSCQIHFTLEHENQNARVSDRQRCWHSSL